jgi:hypothetical protein
MDSYTFKKVTIALGGTVSSPANILGYQVVGVAFPATWTAQNVSLQLDPDGNGTYFTITDLGFVAPAASQITLINTGTAPYKIPILAGVNFRLVSAVAQAAASDLVLMLIKLP